MKILQIIILCLCCNLASAQEKFITKVYDVQDLLIVLPNFTNAPSVSINNALQNRPLFNNARRTTKVKKNPQLLIDLIKNTIEPVIWNDGAYIKYFNGSLIIFAPERIHKQIL